MSPLGFSDEEMDLLFELTRAIPPPSRDGFLQQVASKLAACPAAARGPGLLHRIASEAQRSFVTVAVGGRGKYSLHYPKRTTGKS